MEINEKLIDKVRERKGCCLCDLDKKCLCDEFIELGICRCGLFKNYKINK